MTTATIVPRSAAHGGPRLRRLLALALASVLAMPLLAAPLEVRFPGRGEDGDRRFDFAAELLALCLQKSGGEYRLDILQGMNQPRAREAVRQGRIDVVILPNTAPDTASLVPVKLPLRRGLLGVRLLLARPEDAPRLMTVESTEALKRDFTLGYGRSWLDGEVMRALGFRVEFGASYRGLFDMLRAGRFDVLSRGVNEIHAELRDPALAGRGMVVVPGIALYYPLDDYFWVHRDRRELHADIERGFRRALDDGSYTDLFRRHHADAMREAHIESRSVLHLLGYPVPPGTPLEHFDILELTSSRGSLVAPEATSR
jgi:hypothetical protein